MTRDNLKTIEEYISYFTHYGQSDLENMENTIDAIVEYLRDKEKSDQNNSKPR